MCLQFLYDKCDLCRLNMKKIVQHMPADSAKRPLWLYMASSQKGKYAEHSRFSTKYAEISNHRNVQLFRYEYVQ